jgi:glucan phosphoethanolaminetransferase (alkaline phosphatase superfamily)
MAPQHRREAVAASRPSSPSFSRLATSRVGALVTSLALLIRVAPSLAVRRRTHLRVRKWGVNALVASPAVAIVLADAVRRGAWILHMSRTDLLVYALAVGLSAALWSGLMCVAIQRQGADRWAARLLLAAGAIFAVGAQLYTFDRYQAYLNHQAVLVGTSMIPSIGQQLWSDRIAFAHAVVPALVLAALLPVAGLVIAPLRRRRARMALDVAIVGLLLMAFAAPGRSEQQAATPDVLYISAMGQLARARWDHNETVERVHPGPRTPEVVPTMVARPPARRNVILVLTESVRASSTCVKYDAACAFTPFSNAAAPRRFPLTQMRATDSTTAISLGVMWSGLAPTASRAALHSSPLVWEYARAAGLDTAYWTSQNLLFGNSGAWLEGLPLTRHVSATQLEPDSPLETGADDGKLVDHALAELSELREPYLGVVHLSNTHFPYKIDPTFAPWLPESESTGPGYEKEIKNRYQDAIYLQDRAVGRFLTKLRSTPDGARAVVVFLSDHGEQMREKGAIGHTGTLFDPEIRIPAWIDAPDGTLTEDEEARLRALEEAPLTTLDVLPTLLDLAGVWDAPELAPFRARMPGQSLLRGGSPASQAVVITNCTALWQCAFRNWGAMRGTSKVIAHQYDQDWSCFDTAKDPDEVHDLGRAACGDLSTLAEAAGRGRPF